MRSEITAQSPWMIVGLFGLLAAGLLGCSVDCDQTATCHLVTHDTGYECPDDPALGPVASGCGIWVSTKYGKDENPGTPSEPVKTLARAVELAKSKGPPRVYACGEEYPEAVELPAGISLFGGFHDCERTVWSYEPGYDVMKQWPARLVPGVPGKFALTLSEGDGTSFVGDLVAQAADAVDPGESSIAVFAEDDANASLRRSRFTAGNGADGTDGQPGGDELPAQKGLPGNAGADACAMDVGAGGPAVTLYCDDDTTSIAGAGGDGGEIAASNGGDGELVPVPNPLGYGVGGKAQNPVKGALCTPGIGGAQGVDGIDGEGGKVRGTLSKDGKVSGGKGRDGSAGTPGQGGGGGGGAVGGALCPVAGPKGGAAGGSGGTGGCGGKGGKRGQAGGSSIGIALRSPNVQLDSLFIELGKGGRGGNGGVLQPGGLGGIPASGGSSAFIGIADGCGGGIGGQGGKGGNGGGGRGGHAVAVARSSNDIEQPGGYTNNDGVAGEGGLGGNFAMLATNGDNGVAAPALVLDAPDPP